MHPLLIILLTLVVSIALGLPLIWYAYRQGQHRAQQSAAELTSLNELSRQLLRSQLSIDDLMELIYWQVGQIVPASLFQLGLFDGDAYQIKIWVRDSQRLSETVFPDGGQKGIIGWVRRTGQAILVHDYEEERETLPAFPEFDQADPPRSGLFVPLIAGQSTIGVVAVQSRRPRHFTEEHLRLLTALANQVAWAIRNNQLYENARSRAERLNLISQVTAQVSSVQPLPDLFLQLVTLVKDTFGYYCVTIFKANGDMLRIGASTSEVFYRQVPSIEIGAGLIGWAAHEGQTALASDVENDPRYRRLGILPETRSEIALPLKVERRVVGVMDVQSDQLAAFTSEDVFLLETLAGQVAMAIEQAQTYDEEHRLAQRLEALMQVSQAVVSILDMDELLDKVVDLISETFGYERVHIFLRAGQSITFRAGAGPHSLRWLIDELTYHIDDPGLIPLAARTGRPQLAADVQNSPDYRPGSGLEDTRSELVIPIKMVGQLMGVLDLQSEQVDAFTLDDMRLMQSLADPIAVAIRNAALYAGERRRRGLAETLREISAALVSNLELDLVLDGILSGLERVVSLETAAIMLLEDDGRVFTVAAMLGDDRVEAVGHHFDLGELALDGELDDLVRQVYRMLFSLPDVFCDIIAPLVVEDDLIGYLVIAHHSPGHYSIYDQEIVYAFANQVAVAINNASLYAAQQAESWVTAALLQVAEAVNAQPDLNEALGTIARLTTMLGGVNKCLLLRWDGDSGAYHPGAQFGLPAYRYRLLENEPLPVDTYPFLELLSVAVQPLGAGEGYQLDMPAPLAGLFACPAVLGFPLRAKQELVGLLIVDDPRQGRASDPRLMNILTGIAHQASTALEGAALQASVVERRRLEQELLVARQIQASFIPEAPPQPAGWELTATWRAARQVSGDFYDFIPLQDGLWGLVMADVADKGVPAALFMTMSRTLLRAAAVSRLSPSATLERVNELLHNDSRSDLFVTIFYAVWNPSTGHLSHASAGHNPPLLIRQDAGGVRVRPLPSRGIALGILPEVSLQEFELELEPGDVLVAYTDGITEAMQADYTEWGLDRFVSLLKQTRGQTAEQIQGAVLSAIDDFVGDAPQSDDLTLWLLRRQP